MARKRKNDSALDAVVELVSLMPWWVGVSLAVGFYFWLHSVATSPMAVVADAGQMNQVMTGALWRGLAMAGQYVLPVLCLVGAVTSAFNRRKANRLHDDAANRADGLSQMTWRDFEVLVGEYFRRQGFVVTVNGGGGPDGGVDVWLQRGSDRYLVQCKHWRARRVGVEPIREMYGLIAAQRLAGGYVVTSGDFTDEARSFAQGRELQLINGLALRRGVQSQVSAARQTGIVAPEQPVVLPESTPRLDEVEVVAAVSLPDCPVCGASMALRVARQGANAGKQFWGCSLFSKTRCRGTREVV